MNNANQVDHLIITAHGIRTFGEWQKRLESIVEKKLKGKNSANVDNGNVKFLHFNFNYFSLLAFMVPYLRGRVVRRFRKEVTAAIERHKPARVDFVGHSFGTHVIAWGLKDLDPPLKAHTVILSASVLRADFPWHQLMPERVTRVVNDCGIKDITLLLSQFFVLGTGMAGRTGFVGMEGQEFQNRFSSFRHSGYFVGQKSLPYDNYMATYWAPLLTTEDEIIKLDERKRPGALGGFRLWLINNFEPIKILGYLTPVAVALISVWTLYLNSEISKSRLEGVVRMTDLGLHPRRATYSGQGIVSAVRAVENIPLRKFDALWADMYPGNGKEVRAALSKLGITFHCSEGRGKALNIIKEDLERFQLVITDFFTAGDPMTGLKLASSLKEIGGAPPIILYVSGLGSVNRDQAINAGAEDRVGEPFDLYASVAGVLAKHRTDPALRPNFFTRYWNALSALWFGMGGDNCQRSVGAEWLRWLRKSE